MSLENKVLEVLAKATDCGGATARHIALRINQTYEVNCTLSDVKQQLQELRISGKVKYTDNWELTRRVKR